MKTIAFYAAPGDEFPRPKPAAADLPEFYRKIVPPNRTSPTFSNGAFVSNVRACVPFQDALTAGYIQHTWTDLYIESSGNAIRYYYADAAEPMLTHRDMHPALADAWTGFIDIEFAWLSRWQIQTPKGYSTLVTHPLNRHDLPFTTASGIMDSDTYTNENTGQIPFYFKRGFSGLIPAGTPMYQVIPIKREDWKADYRATGDKRRPKTTRAMRRYFTGSYRRLFWQRKPYA